MEKKTDRRGRVIREEIPYSGIRKVIGQRMQQSLVAFPQGTAMARFDMSEIIKLREDYKSRGISVSYTDIMIKLTAALAKEFPEANSCLENDIITVYETVNVGIAVKVEEILVVPVIMDVVHKDLAQIAADTHEAIDNARNRRFDKLYMDGATITFNNLGMFNVEGCLPILNYPETTLLAMGKISKEAWVDEHDQIVVRPIATITSLINHAVIDGGHASYILTLLKKIIADPRDYIN